MPSSFTPNEIYVFSNPEKKFSRYDQNDPVLNRINWDPAMESSQIVNQRLLDIVIEVQRNLGFPVIVTSGTRTPSFNERIGGSPNSYHLYGTAIDIVVPSDERDPGGQKLAITLSELSRYPELAELKDEGDHVHLSINIGQTDVGGQTIEARNDAFQPLPNYGRDATNVSPVTLSDDTPSDNTLNTDIELVPMSAHSIASSNITNIPVGSVYYTSDRQSVGPRRYLVDTKHTYEASPIRTEDSAAGKPGAFKIGDTWLTVPPSSIEVSEINNIFKIPTARTHGSPYTRDGRSSITVDLDIVFHSIEDINNKLRHIIAQFRRSPFLPVENYFLQSIFYPEIKPVEPEPPIIYEPYSNEFKTGDGRYEQKPKEEMDQWLKRQKKLDDTIASNNPQDVESLINSIEAAGRSDLESAADFRRRIEMLRRIPDHLQKYTNIVSTIQGISYEDQIIVLALRQLVLNTLPGSPEAIRAHLTCDFFNYLPYTNTYAFSKDGTESSRKKPLFNISDSDVFRRYYRGLLYNGGTNEFQDVIPSIQTKLEKLPSSDIEPFTLRYAYSNTNKNRGLEQLAAIREYARFLANTQDVTTGTISNASLARDFFKNISEFLTSSLFTGWVKVTKDTSFFVRESISQFFSTVNDVGKSITHVWKLPKRLLDQDLYLALNIDKEILITRYKNGVPILQPLSEYEKEIIKEGKEVEYGELKVLASSLAEYEFDKYVSDATFDVIELGRNTGEERSTITNLTCAYSPKLIPISVSGYVIPTFQHMGSSEWQISVNIQTDSPSLVQRLRIMNERMNKLSLDFNIGEKYDALSYLANTARVMEGPFFHFLGVENVIPGNFRFSTVEGKPGLTNISIDLIQVDISVQRYEKLSKPYQFANYLLKQIISELSHPAYGIFRLTEPISKDIRESNHIALNQWRQGIHPSLPYNPERNRRWNKLFYNLAKPVASVLAGPGTEGESVLDFMNRTSSGIATLEVVAEVTDGDTIVLDGGEKVRLLGVDTPEKNEAGYEEATKFLESEVLFHNVYIDRSNGKDDYGRTLAWIYLQTHPEVSVNAKIAKKYPTDVSIPNPGFEFHGTIVEKVQQGISSTYRLSLNLLVRDLITDALLYEEKPNEFESFPEELKNKIETAIKQQILTQTAYPDLEIPEFAIQGRSLPPDFFYYKPEFFNIDQVQADAIKFATETFALSLDIARINDVNRYGEATTLEADIDELVRTTTLLREEAILVKIAETARGGVELRKEMADNEISRAELLEEAFKTQRTGNVFRTDSPTYWENRKKFFKDRLEDYDHQMGIIDLAIDEAKNSHYSNIQKIKALAKSWGIITENERELNKQILLDTINQEDSSTLSMARAFPTFKLYFIEKDKEEWILFDDFYSFAAVKSIRVNAHRERASSIAIIELSNISNTLSDISAHNIESVLQNNVREEQNIDNIMLRVGAEIMIRMGYSSNPQDLNVVFHGAITSIQPGEQMTIMAQSWGAELLNPIGIGEEFSIGANSTVKEFGDLAAAILRELPGMDHFGTTYNLAELIDTIPENWIYDSLKASWFRKVSNRFFGPGSLIDHRMDNIWLPFNSVPGIGLFSYFQEILGGKGYGFDWKILNKPAWNALEEILHFHPGYIIKILPYNERDIRKARSTLYIGPSNGYYRAEDDAEYIPDLWLSGLQKYVQKKKQWFANISARSFQTEVELKEFLTSLGWDLSKEAHQRVYQSSLQRSNITSTSPGYSLVLDIGSTEIFVDQDEQWLTSEGWIGDLLDNRWMAISAIHTGMYSQAALTKYTSLNIKLESRVGIYDLAVYDIYDMIHQDEYQALIPRGFTIIGDLTSRRDVNTYSARNPQDILAGGKTPRGYHKACRHHFADSYHHIIENNITASAETFYNKIVLTFPEGEPTIDQSSFALTKDDDIRSIDIYADDSIRSELIRTKEVFEPNIDIDRFQKFLDLLRDSLSLFTRIFSGTEPGTNERSYDIPVEYVVGNVHMNNELKKMYDGNLTLLMNPAITPQDTIYIHDDVNQMYGPVGVREVTHVFDTEAGAYTVVVPDLQTYISNMKDTLISTYASKIFNAAIKSSLIPLSLGTTIGTAAIVAGTPSIKFAGIGILGGGIYSAYKISSSMLIGGYGELLGRQCGQFVPLWYKGTPFVAGVEGMRKEDYIVHMADNVGSFGDVIGALKNTFTRKGVFGE